MSAAHLKRMHADMRCTIEGFLPIFKRRVAVAFHKAATNILRCMLWGFNSDTIIALILTFLAQ
jgi:hypothetical protein